MHQNKSQTFARFEMAIAAFCALNVIFPILNENFLKLKLPVNIEGYSFFLSLGIYLGFKLCKSLLQK
jgi:hypothetical protein